MDVLERVEAHIRAPELIPRGGEVACLVSGGADSTCLWHVLGALGYRVSRRPREPRAARRGVRRGRAVLRRELLGARSSTRSAGRPTEAELRDLRYAADRGRGPARDRPHRLRPGRDGPLPARLERHDARDPRPARGRCRAAAPRRLARGDRGVLPRARPRVPGRLVERRHEARADPRARSCRCSRSSIPRARANLLALAARAAAPPAARSRRRSSSSSRRATGPKRPISGDGVRAVREYDDAPARGGGRVGAVAARERRPGPRRAVAAAGRPARGPVARRCRMCSWTRRCRGPSATPGRSSCPGTTRSSPCRGSPRRRAGKAPSGRYARTAGRQVTSVHADVGEILIDEDDAAGAGRRARRRDLRRLRGPRPPARRRAQGRRLLHRRPDARADGPLRDRLHGDLELRRGDRLLGRRADPQGPRHQHRGPRRARRRGHHRLGAHALVPACATSARASPRRSRSARC